MSLHWINDLELETRIKRAIEAHCKDEHGDRIRDLAREVAREEIRAAWSPQNMEKVVAAEQARTAALEEAAAEAEAGTELLMEKSSLGNLARNIAKRIRSLKSGGVAAAQCADCGCWRDDLAKARRCATPGCPMQALWTSKPASAGAVACAWCNGAGDKHEGKCGAGEIDRLVDQRDAARKERDAARDRLDYEIEQFKGADRGRAESIAERDAARAALAKSNRALDEIEELFYPDLSWKDGIGCKGDYVGTTVAILRRAGRLGGGKEKA